MNNIIRYELNTSVMEYAVNLINENELFIEKLNMAILAEEYVYLKENGKEMVWEAVDIRSIISKAIEWFRNMLSKISTMANSVIAKIQSQLDDNSLFLTKHPKYKLKDTVVLGGYDPKFFTNRDFAAIHDNVNDFIKSLDNFEWEEALKDANQFKKDCMLHFSELFEKKIREYDPEEAYNFLYDYRREITFFRKEFDEAKYYIKTMVSKYSRDAAVMQKEDNPNYELYEKCISASMQILNIIISILKEDLSRFSQYRSLAKTIIINASDGKEEEPLEDK